MVRKGKKSDVPNNPVTQTGSGNCSTDWRLQSSDPNTFKNSRAESNYTKIEDRHLNFERKIVLPDELKVLVEDKITHHGWTFLYEDPIPINVSIVREFYANYWSALATKAEVTPKLGDEIFNVTRKLGIIPYGNWVKQGGGGPTKLKNLEELLSQAHPDLDYSRLEHTPEQQPTQDFEDEDEEGDTSSAAGNEQQA
ncbi:hypothetical protein PIB30_008440 [Stylosanthes scabra]|uniref:Uncharacterized protein n=1 Tax=Stylosanthes scabra TaxID=79078 RepID=A0ABU6W4A5_9FABA|nr:hypothetical protein [Stylosanthes scabra]